MLLQLQQTCELVEKIAELRDDEYRAGVIITVELGPGQLAAAAAGLQEMGWHIVPGYEQQSLIARRAKGEYGLSFHLEPPKSVRPVGKPPHPEVAAWLDTPAREDAQAA